MVSTDSKEDEINNISSSSSSSSSASLEVSLNLKNKQNNNSRKRMVEGSEVRVEDSVDSTASVSSSALSSPSAALFSPPSSAVSSSAADDDDALPLSMYIHESGHHSSPSSSSSSSSFASSSLSAVAPERSEQIRDLQRKIDELERIKRARLNDDRESLRSQAAVMDSFDKQLAEERDWNKTKMRITARVKSALASVISRDNGLDAKELEWKKLGLEWKLQDLPTQLNGLISIGKPLKSLPLSDWKSSLPPECAKGEMISSPAFQKKVREWVKRARSDLKMLFAMDGQFDGTIALISSCRASPDKGIIAEIILKRSMLDLDEEFRCIQSWLAWIFVSFGGELSVIQELVQLSALKFNGSSVVDFKTEWHSKLQELEKASLNKKITLDKRLIAETLWHILSASMFKKVVLDSYTNDQFLDTFALGCYDKLFRLLSRHEESMLLERNVAAVSSFMDHRSGYQDPSHSGLSSNSSYHSSRAGPSSHISAANSGSRSNDRKARVCFFCFSEDHILPNCETAPRCFHGRAMMKKHRKGLSSKPNLFPKGVASFEVWKKMFPNLVAKCEDSCKGYGSSGVHEKVGESQSIRSVYTEGSKELDLIISCRIGSICASALVDTGAEIL